jgi:ACS family tartrate transporter-like MFS transporter
MQGWLTVSDNHETAIGRAAMRKAFWRIIPLIGLAYLCAYMDRVNVSFAAEQMNADLGFSATIYGLGAGLFFLGYALFEIPSNLMLARYGARPWIARIMITWGLLSAATMLVQTPLQFYVVRFLLGVAEAGFYPGVIFYFARWFPPCHRSRAVSRFFIASPLASVVMGAVSGWLLSLDGQAGLQGWQWLFLAMGLPSVFVGLMVLWLLPERPADVDWLNPAEKDWIAAELAREQALIGAPNGHSIMAAFRHPRILLLGIFGALLMAVVTTIVLNAPLFLADMKTVDDVQIGWLVSLGGLLGVAAILVAGVQADRHGERWGIAALFCVVVSLALLVLGIAPSLSAVVAAYLVFATFCFAIPALTSSGWSEVMSVRELAVGAAAINTMSQMGAFAGPFAFGFAKDATGGFSAGLLALAIIGFVSAALLLHVRRGLRARLPHAVAATA